MRTWAQRGQALILALMLLVAGAAALIQLFDAGQLVQEKTRLTNAVDATAYSGAVVQARALNLLSYTNRALVAHQVAMAHDVTLASWALYGDASGRRFAASNPPAGIIGAFFGAGHARAYAGSASLGGRLASQAAWGSGALAQAFAEHDRVVHDVLVKAQVAVHAGLDATRREAMKAVVAANYPAEPVKLDEAMLADRLPGYVARYGGAARARLKHMVEAGTGRYRFLDPRNDTDRSLAEIDVRCPLMRHELRRRGSTVLLGMDTWRSLDTESYHALRSNRWIGCYYREYAMAYGATKAGGGAAGEGVDYVDNPPADFSEEAFWRWVQRYTQWDLLGTVSNPFANSLALGALAQWTGRGLSSYAEVAAADGDAPPSLRFAIRVSRARDDLRTTDARGPRAGHRVLRFDARAVGDDMAAIAAAETFYARPTARADRRQERASLFQPYWQARLVAITDDERQRARRMQADRHGS